jgi:hypothetical protein
MLHLNDSVYWKDGEPYIDKLANTRIRGLSPCGQYALVEWVRHPVPVSELTANEKPFLLYAPADRNHWLPNGFDYSTRADLRVWVGKHLKWLEKWGNNQQPGDSNA